MNYKLLYIAGGGHSGSTLLDMVLGSSNEVFSTGELKFLDKFNEDYVSPISKEINPFDGLCTCKVKMTDCEFWKQVRPPRSEQIVRSWSALESLKIFLNILNPLEKYFSFKTKKGENRRLFDAIYSELTKKGENIKYISDSSKDPRRLYELIKDPNIETSQLSVIHLIRDGRGYVYSFQKKDRPEKGLKIKGTFYLVFEWIFVNLLISWMITKYKLKTTRVVYDKFAQNPAKTIEEINSKMELEIDSKIIPENINKTEYHMVAGNLIRFKKIDSIKYDQKWKKELSKPKILFLSIVFYPFKKVWF